MARILVAEPVAEAGRDVLAASHDVIVRTGLVARGAARRAGRGRAAGTAWSCARRRGSTPSCWRRRRPACRDRRGLGGDRPDRPRGRHPRRGDGRQRAHRQHHRRRRAHHGADAGAAAPRAGGGCIAADRGVGARPASPAASCGTGRWASSAWARSARRWPGGRTASRCASIAHDPYLTEEQAAEHGARLVGLAELLLRADVITVHTPLTPQTRGLHRSVLRSTP